ncbi:MAG TPA: ClcB-like voltage-gated chloride channel protein [Rhodocyclaceae bacterium]|nr:ClcB-like voltage-gated chloride channel protein [Rhodocyclaceae bacterium]
MVNAIFGKLKLFLIERLRPGEMQRMLAIAAVVGVAGALATLGFRLAIAGLEDLLLGRSDSLVQAAMALPLWLRLLFPAVGGVIAGLLLQWAHRCHSTSVSDDYMEAIALGDGRLDVRESAIKAASSAITVATGSSIGREGSMVQLASVAASWIGQGLKISKPRLRLIVACGAAAGITAAYNAPIAGALFVSEIVLRSITIDALGPLLVASILSHITMHQFLGFGPAYHIPPLSLIPGAGMKIFALLGLLAGITAPLFLTLLETTRKGFKQLALPLWAKLGLGGLIVGAISVAYPAVWGNGYSVVDSILQGQWAWQALLMLLIFKLLATAASTGSGAVGGVFTPTLFVGAALGALFGFAMQSVGLSIGVNVPAAACVAVGMGAFLAATTHAPLMATLMIFEMTGDYNLVAPLMLACVLGYVISRVLFPRSIYARSLPAGPSAAFATMSAGDILRKDPPTALRNSPASDIERQFLNRRWPHVYIVDADGHFCGAVSVHDFSPHVRNGADMKSPLADDLLNTVYPRVTPDMSLGRVLEVFAGHSGERLPLVDEQDKLLGYLSKTDLILLLGESVAKI